MKKSEDELKKLAAEASGSGKVDPQKFRELKQRNSALVSARLTNCMQMLKLDGKN